MNVTVRRATGVSVAEKWKNTYFRNGAWQEVLYSGKPAGKIYENLVSLGQDADISAIEEVIGNQWWTRVHCEFCGDFAMVGIEMDVNCGQHVIVMCSSCLRNAAELAETANQRERIIELPDV